MNKINQKLKENVSREKFKRQKGKKFRKRKKEKKKYFEPMNKINQKFLYARLVFFKQTTHRFYFSLNKINKIK